MRRPPIGRLPAAGIDQSNFASPLLAATPTIQIHAFAAITAFALGLIQLAGPKGTFRHRLTGWVWAALMPAVSVSSFFIHEIKLWDPFSPIHLLSVFPSSCCLCTAVAFGRDRAPRLVPTRALREA